MRGLALSGLAAFAAITAQPVRAAPDSESWGAPVPVETGTRWQGGSNAPGGSDAYRRPVYGTQLSRYWMDAAYWIDARAYRLPRPAAGFGWSRYYDDAVLTDQWGRVYDVRPAYDWDHRGRKYKGRRGGWFGGDDYARGPHWQAGGYETRYADAGEDVVTTTVTREEACRMEPRQVVTYENVYAPVYGALPRGKERRTTAPRPRVRGDY